MMGFIHDQLVHAGHSVDYLCAEDLPAGRHDGLARFTFPLLVRRHAVTAARGGKAYDLINVHEPSAAAISTYKAAARSPVVVVTSHGVEQRAWSLAVEELRLGRDGPSLKTRLIFPLTSLWQSRLGLSRADHIFCLNLEDREYLIRWLHLPADKITRIYPAADPLYTKAAEGRNFDRASRLLFAATWRKNKGIEDLIPAFISLAGCHPRLELAVLGAGVPQRTVHAAFPLALGPRVSCIQTSNEAETAAAFASADIYLLPSLFEGTPLTLIEAMMSGMPIVTTDTCGMKDVIRDGKNGLLVPTRSPEAITAAVERLISDAALRARLGIAAQADAMEKYRWERVAAPVRDVYEQLCEGRAR